VNGPLHPHAHPAYRPGNNRGSSVPSPGSWLLDFACIVPCHPVPSPFPPVFPSPDRSIPTWSVGMCPAVERPPPSGPATRSRPPTSIPLQSFSWCPSYFVDPCQILRCSVVCTLIEHGACHWFQRSRESLRMLTGSEHDGDRSGLEALISCPGMD
jgi:hypothetical protein